MNNQYQVPKASTIQTGVKQINNLIEDEFQYNENDFHSRENDHIVDYPASSCPGYSISLDDGLNVNATFDSFLEEETEVIQDLKDEKVNIVTNDTDILNVSPGPVLRYHIYDLFWMFNDNYHIENYTFQDGEVHFLTISYNIDFGNLRISYYNTPTHAIFNSTVFLDRMKRITVATIYPSACFQIINSTSNKFTCMEQLLKFGNTWEKERPYVYVEKTDEIIKLISYDYKLAKSFYFEFKNVQRDMFIHACQFAYTEGFKLQGINSLKK